MFHFAPPAKVARTQRTSVSQASTQYIVGNGGGGAPTTTQAKPSVSGVGGRLGTRTVEFAEMATPDVGGNHRVHSSGPGCNVALCGIGRTIAWKPNGTGTALHVWSLNNGSTATPQQAAPTTIPLPEFPSACGLVAFTAEWVDEESVILCTTGGAVKSLNGRLDFQFSSADVDITISAFAVTVDADGDTCVIAGTTSGLVLWYGLKRSGDDATVLDTRNVNVDEQTNTNTSAGWLSWLTAGRGGTKQRTPHVASTNTATAPNTAISRFEPSTVNPHHVWVVTRSTHVMLLDCALSDLRVVWCTNIEPSTATGGRGHCGTGAVVAMRSIADGVLVLLRAASAQPPHDHDGGQLRRESSSLLLLTIASNTGTVVNSIALAGVSNVLHAPSTTVATLFSADPNGREVTIVYHPFSIHVNNATGVRNPCTSEDVALLGPVSDTVVAARVVRSNQILLLDPHGPYLASPVATATATAHDPHSPTAPACMSPVDALVANSQVPFGVHMSQRIAGILTATRVDARSSIDEMVVNAVEEILQCTPLHVANWARVDMHMEDGNLFTHVTRNLVSRQREHKALIEQLFRHADIWTKISTPVVARLISEQEQLSCLVRIRQQQNDLRVTGAVLPPQQHLSAHHNSIVNVSEGVRQHLSSAVLTAAGISALDIAMDSLADVSRDLLRRVVVDVADYLRKETPTTNLATSAELVFSKPENICLLLRRLNTIVSQTWTIGGGNGDPSAQERFAVTLSSANIFLILLRVVDDLRGRTNVEPIEHDDGTDLSMSSLADIYTTTVVPLLWTNMDDPTCGLQTPLHDQAMLLSDALAAAHSETSSLGNNNHRNSIGDTQKALLDALVMVVDAAMRHKNSEPQYCATLLTRTLLRQPFVAHAEGFPYGAPRPDTTATTMHAASKEGIVRIAERLALQHNVLSVLYLFAAGDYARDPETHSHHGANMRRLCSHQSSLLAFCIEGLVAQDREPELLALPALLAPTVDAEDTASARDAYFEAHAPHLQWQATPSAFQALRTEGAQANPNVAYADDLLGHRSRCLSMSKLAWLASGAPAALKSVYDLETDVCIVAAQRAFLPQLANTVLSVSDVVQKLVQVPGCVPAWVKASAIAARTQAPLRGELHATILRTTLAHDKVKTLLALPVDAVSEQDLLSLAGQTATCQALLASSTLRDSNELASVLERALPPRDCTDATKRDLVHVLANWLDLRDRHGVT